MKDFDFGRMIFDLCDREKVKTLILKDAENKGKTSDAEYGFISRIREKGCPKSKADSAFQAKFESIKG